MWRLVRNFLKKTNAKISVIGDLIRQTHLVAKVENERVNYTKKASIVHIEGKCHQKLPKNKLDTLCKVSFYKSSKFIDFFFRTNRYICTGLQVCGTNHSRTVAYWAVIETNSWVDKKLNLNLHTYNLFVYQYFECRRPQKVFLQSVF